MPLIASGGTIKTVNGKPAVDFNSDYLDTSDVQLNPNGEVNILAVSQWDAVNTNQIVGNQFGADNSERNWYYWAKARAYCLYTITLEPCRQRLKIQQAQLQVIHNTS